MTENLTLKTLREYVDNVNKTVNRLDENQKRLFSKLRELEKDETDFEELKARLKQLELDQERHHNALQSHNHELCEIQNTVRHSQKRTEYALEGFLRKLDGLYRRAEQTEATLIKALGVPGKLVDPESLENFKQAKAEGQFGSVLITADEMAARDEVLTKRLELLERTHAEELLQIQEIATHFRAHTENFQDTSSQSHDSLNTRIDKLYKSVSDSVGNLAERLRKLESPQLSGQIDRHERMLMRRDAGQMNQDARIEKLTEQLEVMEARMNGGETDYKVLFSADCRIVTRLEKLEVVTEALEERIKKSEDRPGVAHEDAGRSQSYSWDSSGAMDTRFVDLKDIASARELIGKLGGGGWIIKEPHRELMDKIVDFAEHMLRGLFEREGNPR